MGYYEEAIERILEEGIEDKEKMLALKKKLAKKHGLSRIPKNSELLEEASEKDQEKIKPLLKKKPTRTMSGVSVVAIMTEPMECPGNCVYCPGGAQENSPKSYTGEEPAAMRAKANNYNSYKQVKNRLEQLEAVGHPTDKIELILMGGTLPSNPEYQEEFVKGALDALNEGKSGKVEEAIKNNEKSRHRCIGMTFETRPDYCKEKQVNEMLRLGGTRVEIGVQNPEDEIYREINRNHTVKDVTEATETAREALMKINYHIMPNLPGSNPEKDLEMFKKLFQDPRYKPDMLKIYPTLLIKPEASQTELYNMWKKGRWSYYGEEKTIELLAKAREHIPKYVRVMRVQRDIPSKLILKGVKSSNLRQLVDKEAEQMGINIKEIRYREIREKKPKKTTINVEEYETTTSTENFISIEDPIQDKIIGFTRLSFPKKSHRPEIDNETAGIRELHVYGPAKPIGSEKQEGEQHKGHGKKLLAKAEELTRTNHKKKLLVISGIGAREYYKKQGYEKEGPYMKKNL